MEKGDADCLGHFYYFEPVLCACGRGRMQDIAFLIGGAVSIGYQRAGDYDERLIKQQLNPQHPCSRCGLT